MTHLTQEQTAFLDTLRYYTPYYALPDYNCDSVIATYLLTCKCESSIVKIPACIYKRLQKNITKYRTLIKKDTPVTLVHPIFHTNLNSVYTKKLLNEFIKNTREYKIVDYKDRQYILGDYWIADGDELIFIYKYRCKLSFDSEGYLNGLYIMDRVVQLSPKVLSPQTGLEKIFHKLLPFFYEKNIEIAIREEHIKSPSFVSEDVTQEGHRAEEVLMKPENADYINDVLSMM